MVRGITIGIVCVAAAMVLFICCLKQPADPEYPFLRITSPAAGAGWRIGTQQHVRWESDRTSGMVRIELMRGGGAWEVVAAQAVDDGDSAWVVAGPASSSCRIRVLDADGSPGDTSEVFAIVALGIPTLQSPDSGSSTTDQTPTFEWADVSGATKYWLQVDTEAAFASPLVIDQQSAQSPFTPSTALGFGVYYWRVCAGDAAVWGDWSAPRVFTVKPEPPALLSPTDGSSTTNRRPTFDWSNVSGATSYRIQIDTESTFAPPVTIDQQPTVSDFTPSSDLSLGLYHWRVAAAVGSIWSDWASPRTLTIDALPGPPTLLQPDSASATSDRTPTFTWAAVDGATKYWIQVDDTETFSSLVLEATNLNQPTYTPTTDLALGTYWWRVKAGNDAGWGQSWSSVWVFTVTILPDPPALVSPDSGLVTTNRRPVFDWTDVSGATKYWLQIADNSAFSSPSTNDSTLAQSTFTPSSDLAYGLHYWRARAGNAAGWGNWSAHTWNITVTVGVPTLQSPTDGSSTTDQTPTFSWSTVTGASRYHIQIDDNSDFSSPTRNDSALTQTSYTVPSNLSFARYYWRVRAGAATVWGGWATERQLDVVPVAPTLQSPTDSSATTDQTPTFAWSTVTGVTRYHIQVDNSSSFTVPLEVDTDLPSSPASYTPTSNLALGTHYWRVMAGGTGVWGDYSGAWSFTISTPSLLDMVSIPGGTFQMGSTSQWAYSSEWPVHTVTVSAFSMARHEVTNEQMREVMQWAYDNGKVNASATTVTNAEGSAQELLDLDEADCEISFSGGVFTVDAGKENHPCIEVTWYGGQAFCNYLSDMEGLQRCISFSDWSCTWSANGYRLPTEAEWEYACRATSTTDYYNGDETQSYCNVDPNLTLIGWYCGNDNGWTEDVGQKQPNDWQLYDMSGNVWEWCNDWWGDYSSEAQTDPTGPSTPGSFRVLRGGSWYDYAVYCRSAARVGYTPSGSDYGLGFRPARR